ncbi:MAG: methionyl-tRNA formyltransferase [Thermicanus sp.]|nr:methionyl-tRNA formyltransferase [Thermicanus sp.]
MGTPDYAVASLKSLVEEGYPVVGVVTQPDKPKGRKRIPTPSPVKVYAQSMNLPLFQPEKLRRAEEVERILSVKPTLIVTAAYGQILPKSLLDAPPFGAINLHASLLPKYRGGAPIHYALLNGEKETGVTLMRMTPELDAGDILAQERIPIGDRDTVGDLFGKLTELAARLLLKTLPDYLEGKITPIPQDHSQATYAPNIKKEEEWLDFSKPAKDLYNQIRAFNPWPGAYTKIFGERIKVWWSEIGVGSFREEPWTILHLGDEGIQVATGDGILVLKEIQPAGKKKIDVASFLRGNTVLAKGMKFADRDEERSA